jgi:hypothetical protein
MHHHHYDEISDKENDAYAEYVFSSSDESETRKHQTCRKARDTRKMSVTPTTIVLLLSVLVG